MATSEDDHVPVRDGHSLHPRHTAPEEMYWLSHMDQEELRDKYVKLKDDFLTIKKFSCRQEDKIKKLQTKLRKLIADRKKDGGNLGSAVQRIQEIEHQETIDTQRQSIRELKLKNEQLEKKLKLANVQLSTAKKNKPMLFRNVGPRVDSGLKQTRTTPSPHPRQLTRPRSSPPKVPSTSEESSFILSPVSVQQVDQMLPERVREILEEARERILALEAERNDLQEHISEIQQASEDTEYEWQQKLIVLEEEVATLRQDLRDRGVREERDSVAIIRAQREAHTLTARSTALQEQLVITEEKVVAEKSRTSSLQSDLERVTGKLHSCENQVKEHHQDLQQLKGQLQQATEKYAILKRENEQLQKENEHLTKLNLSADHRGQTAEVESLKLQIAHLESALQSDLSERGVFLEHMTRDKEEMAKLEVESKELRAKNLELQEQLQKAKQKLDIYDKAGLLNLTQKELELASAKDKESNTSGLSSKEIENLRQAYSELQLLYREKTLELEKTSQALARHASTYKNLQTEIEKVIQESEQKEQDLSSTIKSLQSAIKKRDERSEKLEQQILMLTDKSIKDKLEGLSHDLTQNMKLSKHDNMLEFHIESVGFEASDFSHLKTFVSWTVPFSLEDPLQHTNVAIGKFARFNYSSLYKFQMNHRNLESLRDDSVTASVYILLESGHPAKIGECQLSFCEILEHPRNTLHGTVPITVAHDDADEMKHLPPQLQLQVGEVMGTLNYWFRLQRPCEEIIAQHLRNVGVLSSAQHREDQLPKTVSSMIKSENPLPIRQQEKNPLSVDQPSAVRIKSGKSHKSVESEVHPTPTPTSPSHEYRSPSPECRSPEYRSPSPECRSPEYRSPEYRSPSPECRSPKYRSPSHESHESHDAEPLEIQESSGSVKQEQNAMHKRKKSLGRYKEKFTSKVRSERPDISAEVVEEEPSGVGSPSSTGTYNIGSPPQKPSRIGSPSSTGTYNIGSPSRKQLEDIHNSENESSVIGKECVSPALQTPSENEHKISSENSKLDHLKSNERIPRERSAAPVKPPRTFAKEEDELSRNRRSSSTKHRNLVSRDEMMSSEDSSPTESEGNNTMFEESASSSDSSEELHVKGGRSGSAGDAESQHSRRHSGRNISKVIQSRRIQQLQPHNRRSNSSQGTTSPSRASITSDSEGVVAVVPRKMKAKHSTIYIEVCSLTLLADSAVIQDPLVEFLFVDYHGFLGLPPEQLETPQSLPKPPPGCTLNFSFGQEFSIDEGLYPSRKHALEDLMRNRGLIKFTVTSEPPEELQDTHDCQDLGYAFVNLHDLLKEGQDLQEQDLIVENADDGSEMGTLCITLHILHVLKHLDI